MRRKVRVARAAACIEGRTRISKYSSSVRPIKEKVKGDTKSRAGVA